MVVACMCIYVDQCVSVAETNSNTSQNCSSKNHQPLLFGTHFLPTATCKNENKITITIPCKVSVLRFVPIESIAH